MPHLERGRHRQCGRDVVRVAVVEDGEALVAEPGRQVVLDAVLELQRPIRAVSIEHEPVHVTLRRGGGVRLDGSLVERGPPRCRADLERHDEQQRDRDEDGPHAQQGEIDPGDPRRAETERGHHGHDDDRQPAQLLEQGTDAEVVDVTPDVAVHQEADRERRDDQCAPPWVAEQPPEDDGQQPRHREHHDERRDDIDGVGLAEVLGPQEQHRVGREQQRMERRPARAGWGPGGPVGRIGAIGRGRGRRGWGRGRDGRGRTDGQRVILVQRRRARRPDSGRVRATS